MRRLLSHPAFLPAYAGVLTLAFVASAVLHLLPRRSATFETLRVERLDVVEPDGTLRLALAGNARLPGLLFHRKEYPHPTRRQEQRAGLIFFDGEGTESGGLTFGGARGPDGKVVRFGHLSFDRYAQDEVVSLSGAEDARGVKTGILFKDEPDWPLEELVALVERTPEAEQGKAVQAFLQGRAPMHVPRAWLGRNPDRSSTLELRDVEGRVRLVARVAADGTPGLELLDAKGRVAARLDARGGQPPAPH